MLTAASAWDVLTAELFSAAAAYGSVISELAAGNWSGPSSAAMAAAAGRYVGWLHGIAGQVENTAMRAKAAAAAFELAFAMTVPPAAIAANRSLLAALVATNFFSQNTPAIAATEAHYAEMWAQDAAAMYGYAASSSAASPTEPFADPPPTANPAGLAAQAGALAQSAGTPVVAQATTLPTILQQLAAPLASSAPMLLASAVLHVPNVVNSGLASSAAVASGRGIYAQNLRLAAQAAKDADNATGSGGRLVTSGTGGAAMSARLGRANMLSSLSVPPGWTTAAAEGRPVAVALTNTGIGVAPTSVEAMMQPPGGSFSQAVLATLSRQNSDNHRVKSKPVITRTPAAG